MYTLNIQNFVYFLKNCVCCMLSIHNCVHSLKKLYTLNVQNCVHSLKNYVHWSYRIVYILKNCISWIYRIVYNLWKFVYVKCKKLCTLNIQNCVQFFIECIKLCTILEIVCVKYTKLYSFFKSCVCWMYKIAYIFMKTVFLI